MMIQQLRTEKIVAEYMLKELRKGHIPTQLEIDKEISKYKLINPFDIPEQITIENYNKITKEILEDLKMIYLAINSLNLKLSNQKRLNSMELKALDYLTKKYKPSVIFNQLDMLLDPINSKIKIPDSITGQNQIIDKIAQELVIVEVIAKSNTINFIDNVVIRGLMLKETEIELYISSDDVNWKKIYTGKFINQLIYNIDASISSLKIILKKFEADKYINNKYQYIFNIDEIIYDVNIYDDTVIKTYESPIYNVEPFNAITFIADENIIQDTNIEYQIKINDSTYDIKNNTKTKLYIEDSVQFYDIIRDTELAQNAFLRQNLSIKNNVYELYKSPVNIYNNELYKGYNQWHVTSVDAHNPTLSSFIGRPYLLSEYTPYSETINYIAESDGVYKFSIGFHSQLPRIFNRKIITSQPITLYINNWNTTIDKNKDIGYNIKSGFNIIDIVVKMITHDELIINLSLSDNDIIESKYGSPYPMKQLDLIDFQYNSDSLNSYTILNDTIYIKDSDIGIRYNLINKNKKDQFDNIQFIAKLSTTKFNLSPLLKNYTLTLEEE